MSEMALKPLQNKAMSRKNIATIEQSHSVNCSKTKHGQLDAELCEMPQRQTSLPFS